VIVDKEVRNLNLQLEQANARAIAAEEKLEKALAELNSSKSEFKSKSSSQSRPHRDSDSGNNRSYHPARRNDSYGQNHRINPTYGQHYPIQSENCDNWDSWNNTERSDNSFRRNDESFGQNYDHSWDRQDSKHREHSSLPKSTQKNLSKDVDASYGRDISENSRNNFKLQSAHQDDHRQRPRPVLEKFSTSSSDDASKSERSDNQKQKQPTLEEWCLQYHKKRPQELSQNYRKKHMNNEYRTFTKPLDSFDHATRSKGNTKWRKLIVKHPEFLRG
jgi:hypothetical protein